MPRSGEIWRTRPGPSDSTRTTPTVIPHQCLEGYSVLVRPWCIAFWMWRIDGLLKQHVKKMKKHCVCHGVYLFYSTCRLALEMLWNDLLSAENTNCKHLVGQNLPARDRVLSLFSRVKLCYVYIATSIFGSFWYGFGPNQCDLTMWNLSHHLGESTSKLSSLSWFTSCCVVGTRLPGSQAPSHFGHSSA